MDIKEIGLNNDDLCYYTENNKKYLKACDEGYYCEIINSESGVCLEYKPVLRNIKKNVIKNPSVIQA